MEKSFDDAWRECSDSLRGYVRHAVSSSLDAADILGDIALCGLENWHRLGDKEKSRAWLFQIARNIVRDYYRSHHRRFSRALDSESIQALISEYSEIDFDRIAAKEFIAKLDGLCPVAVTLNLYHGYTYKEIAKLTGQSRSTIAHYIPRIIEQLASALYSEDESHG